MSTHICRDCGFVDEEQNFDQVGLDKMCPNCGQSKVTERNIGYICLQHHFGDYEKELISASSDHCEVRIDCDRCDDEHVVSYTSHM